MWHDTKAAKLLGIKYPILQGPFGGNLSSVKLAATVSDLGGLGGYGAYTLTPEEIITLDGQLKEATRKPYNINLWVSDTDSPSGSMEDGHFERAMENSNRVVEGSNRAIEDSNFERIKNQFKPYFDELGLPFPDRPAPVSSKFDNQVEALLHVRPPVFSFVFGIPSPAILAQCRKSGIVTIGAATTLDEAIALEAAEVDLIVASGFEAGGHRPSFLAPAETSLTGTFALVQQIREKVKTPIIAAGGIATGRGVAAALALGADGVQIGTTFLACEESNALDIHRQMLFADESKYSVLTRAFTGRLGRGLKSRISEDLAGKRDSLLPFPLQTQFMSSLRKAAIAQQKWDLVLFWGGQIAPVLKHKKAADLMSALVDDTTDYFKNL
jgi:nitronate monooxygenase